MKIVDNFCAAKFINSLCWDMEMKKNAELTAT